MQRTHPTGIGGIAVAVVALALMTLSPWEGRNAVARDLNEQLRGEYALTFSRVCADEGFEEFGFILGFVPNRIDIQGIVTYDRAGGGSFNGRQLFAIRSGPAGSGIPSGAGQEIIVGQADVADCSVNYEVMSDGSFEQTFSDCALTVQTGPRTGGTLTLDGLRLPGHIGLDGRLLLLSHTGTEIETLTITGSPPDPPFPPPTDRICNGSGLAVKVDDDKDKDDD